MKYFIPLVLFVVVGCGRGPVTGPTNATVQESPATKLVTPPTVKPVDDGMTSVADLVKWKDEPKSFVGKKIKVRALYYNPLDSSRFPDRSLKVQLSYGGTAPFSMVVHHNNVDIPFNFTLDLKDVQKMPNALPGEVLVIEFEVNKHPTAKDIFVNRAVSISR